MTEDNDPLPRLIFAASPTPTLPIRGRSESFPVRRIYCVGRNYAEHAREMGYDPTREPPFFFSKPADALVAVGEGVREVAYPPATTNLQHEVELVVALGKGGANIAVDAAPGCVFGYAVGIDLTRRDLQFEARSKGQPWDMAKGFDQSAPASAIRELAEGGHALAGEIALAVNGAARQHGDLRQMIWSVAEVIARLSSYVTLMPGDLIFTGTPAGVSTVTRGDLLHGRIEGVGELSVRMV